MKNKEHVSNTEKPKVSIVSISYNQEKYIEQALRSFLEQRTDFRFEIIIADDRSSDNTPSIISKYAEKYPEIVKPILRKKNIGIQSNLVDALKHAEGDYIALCEGDDYWTDPLKLQKQYDFLSKRPDYGLCFHLVKVFYENNEHESEIYPKLRGNFDITTEHLLKENFIQTNSVMYKRKRYDAIPIDILPLDWYLHLYHAKDTKIGFIDEVMSAYRRHEGGVWWDSYRNLDEIWTRHGVAHYSMYCEIGELFANKLDYQVIIQRHIHRTLGLLIDTDRKFHTKLASEVLKKYPHVVDPLTVLLATNLPELEAMVKYKDDQISSLNSRIAEMNHEFDAIETSRLWRVFVTLKKFKAFLLGNRTHR